MSSYTLGTDFAGAPLLASYVNGRLLTAGDLSTDQRTLTERDRRIGRAAGAGVVDGLTVTASATTLTVNPGLGLTGIGEPLMLKQTTSLPLAVPLAQVPSRPNPARFGCCDSADPGTGTLVAAGSYVLTARPASQSQGSAATAGPPAAIGSGGCVAAWTAAGIEFRVTALPVGTTVDGIAMTSANRRNLVANWCFGVEQRRLIPANPFIDPKPSGPALAGLDPADLPLAVLAWDGQTIADLDAWSVRRPVTAPPSGTETWGLLSSPLRTGEGQARWRQFQDQAAELVRQQVASTVVAATTFPLLPAAGLLPIGVEDREQLTKRLGELADQLAERTVDNKERVRLFRQGAGTTTAELALLLLALRGASGTGFVLATFFGDSFQYGGILDWDVTEFLLRESWYRAPQRIDADADDEVPVAAPAEDLDAEVIGPARPPDPQEPQPPGTEQDTQFTVYLVRENLVALALKGRQKKLRRLTGTTAISDLYVVFVANYLWWKGARPPVALPQRFVPRQ